LVARRAAAVAIPSSSVQLLTLLYVLLFYTIFDDLREKFRRR